MADAEPLTAYFTIEELRAHHPELVSETRFTGREARGRPRLRRAVVRARREGRLSSAATSWRRTSAPAGRSLFLRRHVEVGPVTAVEIDGVALSAGELAELVVHDFGVVERAAGGPRARRSRSTYTHGFTEPSELAKQAVMMLAAAKALPSTIPARATALSTDAGSFRISQADKTGKTGHPRRRRHHRPAGRRQAGDGMTAEPELLEHLWAAQDALAGRARRAVCAGRGGQGHRATRSRSSPTTCGSPGRATGKVDTELSGATAPGDEEFRLTVVIYTQLADEYTVVRDRLKGFATAVGAAMASAGVAAIVPAWTHPRLPARRGHGRHLPPARARADLRLPVLVTLHGQ